MRSQGLGRAHPVQRDEDVDRAVFPVAVIDELLLRGERLALRALRARVEQPLAPLYDLLEQVLAQRVRSRARILDEHEQKARFIAPQAHEPRDRIRLLEAEMGVA